VYVLYVDESGSHGLTNNNQAYVLAGVAIHEADVVALGAALHGIVERALPPGADPARYELHAAELRRPSGRSSWGEIDGNVRRSVLERALTTIASFSELDANQPLRLFIEVLKPGARREHDAYGRLLNRFDDWLAAKDERAIVISDVSKREQEIQNWARRWQAARSQWGQLDRVVEVPLFADSRASRLLQAADLAAWTTWRRFGVDPYDDHWWQIIEARVDLVREAV
jgi:hypothetical protein